MLLCNSALLLSSWPYNLDQLWCLEHNRGVGESGLLNVDFRGQQRTTQSVGMPGLWVGLVLCLLRQVHLQSEGIIHAGRSGRGMARHAGSLPSGTRLHGQGWGKGVPHCMDNHPISVQDYPSSSYRYIALCILAPCYQVSCVDNSGYFHLG